MSIRIILFAGFKLSFQEEGEDSSHKDFSKAATLSVIVGSNAGGHGRRTCKKVVDGRN